MSKKLVYLMGAGFIIIMSIFFFKMFEDMRLSDWSVSARGVSTMDDRLSLPEYPAARNISKEMTNHSDELASSTTTTIRFSTSDDPDRILGYYKDRLTEAKFNLVDDASAGTEPSTTLFQRMSDYTYPMYSVRIKLKKLEDGLTHVELQLGIYSAM